MLDFNAIAKEPYDERGIPNSEMAFILHVCHRMNIDIIIESGRARGHSTYCLAKYSGAHVHSVELRPGRDERIARERLKGFPNVTLHTGNGAAVLPGLVSRFPDRRIAILLDGPKGDRAIPVLAECFQYRQVKVGFIHDMRKLDHGKPSIHRELAIKAFPNHRFTDDEKIVAATQWMDGPVAEAGGPVGEKHMEQFGSYGPTIGAFFPQQQQQASEVFP